MYAGQQLHVLEGGSEVLFTASSIYGQNLTNTSAWRICPLHQCLDLTSSSEGFVSLALYSATGKLMVVGLLWLCEEEVVPL